MRATSLYCFDCTCGRRIETPATTVLCPGCGATIEIHWQPEQRPTSETKTISERYET